MFFSAAWVASMVSIALVLCHVEIKRHETKLKDVAVGVVASVKNKLDANEAVLAGFSSFLLAVKQSDTEAVTRYAAAISASYPHIYMLEIARRVPVDEKNSFERVMRRSWKADFAIKNFREVANTNIHHSGQANENWPILFMYPALPEADAIYGVKLETVPHLYHTLGLAKRNAKAVVSPVFEMHEGGSAYILLKEVGRTERRTEHGSPNFFGDLMTALVLVKTENLIDPSMKTGQVRIVGTLKSAALQSDVVLQEARNRYSRLNSLFLPNLNLTLDVGNSTQPMSLTFDKQLIWSEVLSINTGIVLLLFLCACIGIPVLVQQHLRLLRSAETEHQNSSYLATHDVLTKLPNRYLFADRFNQAVFGWQRNGTPFALMLIDIDDFKAVNDRYGHDIGDQVLRICADRIVRELRASDTIARYGGDEFIGLLTNLPGLENAEKVAEKLTLQLAHPIDTSVGAINTSISIGISFCPVHGKSLEELRATADVAMYEAKKSGKNQCKIYRENQTQNQ